MKVAHGGGFALASGDKDFVQLICAISGGPSTFSTPSFTPRTKCRDVFVQRPLLTSFHVGGGEEARGFEKGLFHEVAIRVRFDEFLCDNHIADVDLPTRHGTSIAADQYQ
ncbi:hypothetical protein CLIM01_10647 [Colletotrichum limetticola]|uniref:Uncharacterized protein n=1 Tax=Colletotrichum limetticola TaxID=1209924 RepID=A0ABQ9PL76_9PEZI|nr:hypothetical protein CLIM01_10647 [Colletotrichum limetticola]